MTKPAEIRALAGARAFPPLVLVMFHFSEGHGYRNFWPLDLLAARGYLWVEFFFCLSGFILTHVYGERLAKLFTRDGYIQFLKARLTRLYPLHLFMLLAVLAVLIVTRILAHIGGYHSIFDYRRALRQGGVYVHAGGGGILIFQVMLLGPLLSPIESKKVRFFIAKISKKDLAFLKDLLEAGKVVPIIDRRYPLNEVAAALRYLEEGHAQGKVVITVEHGIATSQGA